MPDVPQLDQLANISTKHLVSSDTALFQWTPKGTLPHFKPYQPDKYVVEVSSCFPQTNSNKGEQQNLEKKSSPVW